MGILRRGFMFNEDRNGFVPYTDPYYPADQNNDGYDQSHGHKLSAGAIAGISVAGAVVLICLLLLCFCCCLKWKRRRSSKRENYVAETKHAHSKKLPFFCRCLKWKRKNNKAIPVTGTKDGPEITEVKSVAKEVEVVSTNHGGSTSKSVEVETEEIVRAAALKHQQRPPVVGIKAPLTETEPEVLIYVDQPAPPGEHSDSEDNPHVTVHRGIVARPSTSPDVFNG